MSKVKMSDIISGSEEVKSVFKRPMINRLKSLKKQIFTNDELLEIVDISENIENHNNKRAFYQNLILSQNGPFNNTVFGAYIDKLFHVDTLLHLINHSPDISEKNKLKWVNYLMVVATHWTVFNFFSKGSGNGVGIDVTQSPFNSVYAANIVRYVDKANNGTISDAYKKELHRILDTMTEGEIYEWYVTEVAITYEKRAMEFIMSYNRIPSNAIAHYWEKTTFSSKEKLALHPNCPEDLIEYVFDRTGREEYLPQAAKDIFLF